MSTGVLSFTTLMGFNEAGGFLPRKPAVSAKRDHVGIDASMRPEDFSPGNGGWRRSTPATGSAMLQ